MPESLHLPELARSLRALGTARDACAESAHAAVFGPLLEARAQAAAGDLEVVLAAFRGQALSARIGARAADAARATEAEPARVRARVTRAREAVDPLRAELDALDARLPTPMVGASPVAAAPAAWMAQLARVFRAADTACHALALVLAEPVEPERRGWWGRPGR